MYDSEEDISAVSKFEFYEDFRSYVEFPGTYSSYKFDQHGLLYFRNAVMTSRLVRALFIKEN